jgi:tetratricopeptide (TPR) repeat protein
VRRNKTVFAAAGVGLAALVIGLVLSLYLFIQERVAFKRAMVAEQTEKYLREQAEKSAAWSHKIAQAGLFLMEGKYDESQQLIREIPPHMTLVAFYNVFGNRQARIGHWQEALTNWNMVVQYAPEDHLGYMYLAPLLLQLDDVNGYKQCRTQILQHFANTSDPRIAERMVKASLILPPTADELTSIAKMADVAGKGEVNGDTWGYNLSAQGLAQYRLGHYADAAELMQKAIALDIGSTSRTEARLVLAMAQYQLGQSKQCQATFAEVVHAINHDLRKVGHLEDEWNDWIGIHILMREAQALMPDVAKSVPDALPEKPAWQEALAKSGFKFNIEQQDDGTWEVDLDDQPVTDISMLHDAPLSRLTMMHAPVSDLTPLRGMSLNWLRLSGTKVADLSPLAGMPLKYLQMSGTLVSDISPLRGMPLKFLSMHGCTAITNLEPLKGITTLESVTLPPNAKNFEFLRNEPGLTRISFKYDKATRAPAQSAEEFWAQQDASGKTASAQP